MNVFQTEGGLMMISEPNLYGGKRISFNECLIGKKRMYYDACDSRSLDEAKKYYPADEGWKHIGTSIIAWHKGVPMTFDKRTHFFIHTNKK